MKELIKELVKGHEDLLSGLGCLFLGIISSVYIYFVIKNKPKEYRYSPSDVKMMAFGHMMILGGLFMLLVAMCGRG